MTREPIYRGFVPEMEILRAKDGGSDGRTIVGIAVPYGRAQRISPDLTEQFAPGVVRHQLDSPSRVKAAREHMALGGALIGRALEIRDDAAGLWSALRVSKTPAGDETLELVRDGALDEQSVGFYERPRGNRVLSDGTIERTQVDLFEIALVPFGAYGRGATVKGVRSASDAERAASLLAEDDRPIDELDEAAIHRLAQARALLAGARSF